MEVPSVIQQERAIEVTQVQLCDCITQVSAPVTEVVNKEVPSIQLQVQERMVEVPHTLIEDRIVEVPQVQVCEQIRQEHQAVVQEVQKTVPRISMEYVEQIQQVQANLP